MRRLSLAFLVAFGVSTAACGPTVFKGPVGPPPGASGLSTGGSRAIIEPVEMPFAVHTRSRNGVTRLHSQLVAGDFVSSGVMVAATSDLTKPIARIVDARQILAVEAPPRTFTSSPRRSSATRCAV